MRRLQTVYEIKFEELDAFVKKLKDEGYRIDKDEGIIGIEHPEKDFVGHIARPDSGTYEYRTRYRCLYINSREENPLEVFVRKYMASASDSSK